MRTVFTFFSEESVGPGGLIIKGEYVKPGLPYYLCKTDARESGKSSGHILVPNNSRRKETTLDANRRRLDHDSYVLKRASFPFPSTLLHSASL